MTHWLSRQEKVSLFQSYLKDFTSEDDRATFDLSSTSSLSGVTLATSKRPAVHSQTISSIQHCHHAPSFSLHLRQFLNSLLPSGESIPCTQLAAVQLPFDRLDVLENDMDGKVGVDKLKAKPGKEGDAQFDTVLVAHRDVAKTTGLEGKSLQSLDIAPTG